MICVFLPSTEGIWRPLRTRNAGVDGTYSWRWIIWENLALGLGGNHFLFLDKNPSTCHCLHFLEITFAIAYIYIHIYVLRKQLLLGALGCLNQLSVDWRFQLRAWSHGWWDHEPKARVGRSTDCTTQEPLRCLLTVLFLFLLAEWL